MAKCFVTKQHIRVGSEPLRLEFLGNRVRKEQTAENTVFLRLDDVAMDRALKSFPPERFRRCNYCQALLKEEFENSRCLRGCLEKVFFSRISPFSISDYLVIL